MKYAIIANPVSGNKTIEQKKKILRDPARILDAEIYGLDTTSCEDFMICANDLSKRVDTLVVVGGDGTFSDVLNAIDTNDVSMGYIPMGTGNALQYILGIKPGPLDAAIQVKLGTSHDLDTILCNDEKKAFMSSIGFDGEILEKRQAFMDKHGNGGVPAYMSSIAKVMKKYKPFKAHATIDGLEKDYKRLFSWMITKIPYYGMGVKVAPSATFDSENLHSVQITNHGHLVSAFFTAMSPFGYLGGIQSECKHIHVETDRDIYLQRDGTLDKKMREFDFKVLPKDLRIIY
ncbi:hypothetical protein GOV14_01410 [Candidatus Pacearchaeota archaeon]|nr:hypothetical protein [Candidatus Pacearchaeota archaeon]